MREIAVLVLVGGIAMRMICVTLVAVFAVAATDREKIAAPVVKEVAKNYRQLRAVTTQPVDVDPGLLGLCRWLSPKEIEEAKKKNGPHAISQIKIYMDESGAEAAESPPASNVTTPHDRIMYLAIGRRRSKRASIAAEHFQTTIRAFQRRSLLGRTSWN
jgi:hypothetical protein